MAQRSGKRATRTAEMRRRALSLRIAGASYHQIGEALGINQSNAYRHVQAALDLARKETAENAEKVREMELRRLDELLVAAWPNRADPRVHDTILRNMARRAAMQGLDAPNREEVTLTDDLSDEERAARVAAIVDAARARRTGPADP